MNITFKDYCVENLKNAWNGVVLSTPYVVATYAVIEKIRNVSSVLHTTVWGSTKALACFKFAVLYASTLFLIWHSIVILGGCAYNFIKIYNEYMEGKAFKNRGWVLFDV